MISDVPIGAFLSGGVDSSSVVAMMATLSNTPIKTFTIGFEEQVYDERPFARQVAERYKTDHYEEVVRPDGMSVIEDLVYHYGEPYADSSAVPTYYVSRIARQFVTVALNGDGGDESFLGYPRYLRCRNEFQEQPSLLPRPFASQLASMLKRLPADRFGLRSPGRGASRTSRTSRAARSTRSRLPISRTRRSRRLYAGDMRRFLQHPALSRLDAYLDQAQTLPLGAAWADVHNYLPDCLMVKVDVASMAHSLEARSPLLDHKLMEWAATIPEEQRFRGRRAQVPVQAGDGAVPAARPAVSTENGFRRSDRHLAAYRHARLRLRHASRARGRASADCSIRPMFARLLDRHVAGENRAYWIWALLMLELWFRMWIDSDDAFAHPVARRIVGGRTAASSRNPLCRRPSDGWAADGHRRNE